MANDIGSTTLGLCSLVTEDGELKLLLKEEPLAEDF
jgi:hypothetical protein